MTPELARRLILRIARRVSIGTLTVIDGDELLTVGPGGAPTATLRIVDRRAWPLLARGLDGAVEAAKQGWWDSPDLAALFRLAALNVDAGTIVHQRLQRLRLPALQARHAARRYTREHSRRDIAAHYDLGDDLFTAMLDPTMAYSCAIYPAEGASLQEAQEHKFETICRKLDITRADHVVEIGGGWGGFAIHAAGTRGCRVTTTTISKAQFNTMSKRVAAAGLGHLVEVRSDHYRDLRGRYDKLVSVEMIEAVPARQLGMFFAKCSALLEPTGAMLLQAIAIDDRLYDANRLGRSFVTTHIFPNGCLPSPGAMARQVATRTDLRLVHLEDLTKHYPPTLRAWASKFDASSDELRALDYDDAFQRIWRIYLAYACAGFELARTSLLQLVLAKPNCRPSATLESVASQRKAAAK